MPRDTVLRPAIETDDPSLAKDPTDTLLARTALPPVDTVARSSIAAAARNSLAVSSEPRTETVPAQTEESAILMRLDPVMSPPDESCCETTRDPPVDIDAPVMESAPTDKDPGVAIGPATASAEPHMADRVTLHDPPAMMVPVENDPAATTGARILNADPSRTREDVERELPSTVLSATVSRLPSHTSPVMLAADPDRIPDATDNVARIT